MYLQMNSVKKEGFNLPPTLVNEYRLKTPMSEKDFDQFYFQYHRIVFSISLRFLKDKQLAEDAVQDVFIKIWNHRHTIDMADNVLAFVTTITRNCLLNKLRKHKNEIIKIAAASMQTISINQEETEFSFDWKMNLQMLDQCLKKMPPRKRQIFSLKIFSGLSNEEIAKELGLSVNTIKFQYSEAKTRVENNFRKISTSY